jgi:hypothetical protein
MPMNAADEETLPEVRDNIRQSGSALAFEAFRRVDKI